MPGSWGIVGTIDGMDGINGIGMGESIGGGAIFTVGANVGAKVEE